MVGTIDVKVNAARPNLPLQPLFAFKGSPSSVRVIDVPKTIGNWNINTVRLSVTYPDNSQKFKEATRVGNVWVATIEGCAVAGKVGNGYEILADGVDENNQPVTGYVLGKGDVFILERDSTIPDPGLERFYVKYCDTVPTSPATGDLVVVEDSTTGFTLVKIYNGEEWVCQTMPTKTSQLENDSGFITVSAIPSQISAFQNDVGYITASAIPSTVSSFQNDAGYITASAIPTNVSAFVNDADYTSKSYVDNNFSKTIIRTWAD